MLQMYWDVTKVFWRRKKRYKRRKIERNEEEEEEEMRFNPRKTTNPEPKSEVKTKILRKTVASSISFWTSQSKLTISMENLCERCSRRNYSVAISVINPSPSFEFQFRQILFVLSSDKWKTRERKTTTRHSW